MNEEIPVHRPTVAQPSRRISTTAVVTVLVVSGLGVFMWLSDARAAQGSLDDTLPQLASTAMPAPAILTPSTPVVAATPPAAVLIPNSPPSVAAPVARFDIAPGTPAVGGGAIDRARERLRAPTLIIDLVQSESARASAQVPGVAAVEPGPAGTASNQATNTLSDTERFAARVGSEETQAVQAQHMTGLSRLVPQGAIIAAVMETALNSDLPGFARALTQRDVYSFDGSAVLIPAGSRIIGQYKSGVAQGASRVFILWTRLIRPDGVSIELASPAVDELGRGGVSGKVNRHFFQRFGGAILQSVLTGGINAAAASVSGGSTIVVSTASEATSLAGQASRGTDIPPTITTRQGAAVRIFVARDLDFTRVGPMQ
ncbi:TrbI/VirB10 family protein [Blastomonas sp.]|uniref:TrbI/VirB10 family protein n=1 Tax=Blastomonas sp. TaxID=1909299 RepID=UPI0035940517